MRTAVKDTNVVLNMAISPGVILVPSNMIILTDMVAGYNNILKIVGIGMRFGENSGVNYYGTDSETTAPDTRSDGAGVPKTVKPKSETSKPHTKVVGEIISDNPNTLKSEMYLLITTVVCGSLVSKFLL